ncbi:tyrosine-type recombinase/integrase [Desulfofustis glycolicus]|nr:tyrosine-type recombinase/integrase [Desulfofustis glycolicus]
MMTEELSLVKTSVFDQKTGFTYHSGSKTAHYHNSSAELKRYTTHRWCSRLAASKLPGADLAVEYLYAKYIRNLSVSTIQQSGGIILYFLHFLVRDGTSIYALTRQNISAYVEYEQERGLKVQSVVNHLRAVYTFIGFLVERGVLPEAVLQSKIKIKLPQALPKAIPLDDIRSLLAVITTARDRALILLLLRTGMRIGELLAVKLSDLIYTERKILIYLGEKNYQGRVVYYSRDAEHALHQWLSERDDRSEYLFPGQARRLNLSYVAAWSVMRNAISSAGLSGKGYSLHSLRHTFATDMLNGGMRIEVLQRLLGHQEIEMTMRYARVSDKTRELEYFKAMDRIEQGSQHGPQRINLELQKVFEEKKLLRSHRKKLS